MRKHMMNLRYPCQSAEHTVARRGFLGTMAATGAAAIVGGLGAFTHPVLADQLKRDQKRIVI